MAVLSAHVYRYTYTAKRPFYIKLELSRVQPCWFKHNDIINEHMNKQPNSPWSVKRVNLYKMLKMTSFFIVPFNMAVALVSLHNRWPESYPLPLFPLKWLWSYSPSTIIRLKMTSSTCVPFKMAVVILSLNTIIRLKMTIYHCSL